LPRKWRLTWSGLRLIRGRRYNRLKKKAHGREDRTFWGAQFGPPKTYDSLAKEYGVGQRTIFRDAKFAEEVEASPELTRQPAKHHPGSVAPDPGTEIQPTEKGGGKT